MVWRRSGWTKVGLLVSGLGLAFVPLSRVDPETRNGATPGSIAAPPLRPWLCLEPSWWSPTAETGELRVRRVDGGAWTAVGEGAPWVGITFDRLVRLRTRVAAPGSPDVLAARLPPLGELWDPPPRIGDRLLVVVYVGRRPLGAAAALPLRAAASRPDVLPAECRARDDASRAAVVP